VSFADHHLPIDSDAVLIEGPPVALCPATDPSNTGRSFPQGATVLAEGVNFSVFSREASRVELLLFDDAAAAHPTRVIELDPRTHRTYHYWHVFMPGIRSGQVYAYRADGPFDLERGLRFDPAKVLLDPYGRAVVVPDGYSRQAASQYGENNAAAMKGVVVDTSKSVLDLLLVHLQHSSCTEHRNDPLA
jgi:glycogen operon protein